MMHAKEMDPFSKGIMKMPVSAHIQYASLTPDVLVTLTTFIYSFDCCYMTTVEGWKHVCYAGGNQMSNVNLKIRAIKQ